MLAAVVAPWSVLFLLAVGACVYVAYIALRTRDVVRRYSEIAPVDRWLLRLSGLLAPFPVTLFLGSAYGLEAAGYNVNVVVFGNAFGWTVVTTLFEFGFIAAFAAIAGAGTVPHVRPAFLWRALAIPLLVIYFLYLVGTITRGFGDALG